MQRPHQKWLGFFVIKCYELVLKVKRFLKGHFFLCRDASVKERQTGENIVFRPQNVSGKRVYETSCSL